MLGTVFQGKVEMRERLEAIAALDKAIAAAQPEAILIDLSAANLAHYGAGDALALADRINRESARSAK